MMDHELLRDLTESYLKSLISETAGELSRDFDSLAPFGELGINSFHVLKIIKMLEADFGTLPKSLLFENFNINDLANYFVRKHDQTLCTKFAKELQRGPRPVAAPIAAPKSAPPAPAPRPEPRPAPARAEAIRILEKDALAIPELKELVETLFARHGTEGCISRGTRKIAPNLFIGSDRRGYFNYARRKDLILVYGYAGPQDYLFTLAGEMHRYCESRGFQMNVMGGDPAPVIGSVAFSATPFGVMQRVVDLKSFKLDGGPMRRLRYQVSKFEKHGPCRTEEYRPGTNADVDRDIAEIIDRWCESRTVVNPLIYDVKAEILAGTLPDVHRLFLTYLDNELQNAILITRMSEEDPGYLMDLEFYRPDMPLGGLEFAIVEIIKILVPEGCDVLSLGGTYGVKLEDNPNADPGVDKILDDLRAQGIFNDEGNLQFKNKFRPDNKPIFLSRPVGSGNPDNVVDIIMMIADPLKMQTSDAENYNYGANAVAAPVVVPTPAGGIIAGIERSRLLAEHGFNPLNVPHEHVAFDLKTDSWAQLHMPAIDAQMRQLHAKLQQPIAVDESVRLVFPFAHSVLTASGQAAENLFFRAWPKRGLVLQNLLFPSTIFHEIDKGFANKELPTPRVFDPQSSDPFKGNLDWDAVQAIVAKDAESLAFVCVEVGNNAAGGGPVSLRHLRELRSLLTKHGIPLVLDGTRIVENAQLLIEREEECAGKSVWAVVRETFSLADAVIGSLTKDFCVDKGGIVATNDAKLFARLEELLHEEGGGVDLIERKLIALALQDRRAIETKVLRRMEATRAIHHALRDIHVPIVEPEGGHCVLVDVRQIAEFKDLADPVASFVAWLYLNTGIRAAAHSVGMQRGTRINDLVRLAIPVGMKRDAIDELIARLKAAFANKINIPELTREAGQVGPLAAFRLTKYHNVVEGLPPKAPGDPKAAIAPQAPIAPQVPSDPKAPSDPKPEQPLEPVTNHRTAGNASERSAQRQPIAIIGMAGRYPKARNVRELWDNLAAGRDCIEEIPAERYERRLQYESIEKYRGGFIDDVDKFDSLFFNISPREAEMLDPQERLFLEVAWEAIEDAGYYPEVLGQEDAFRNIGVYVGAVWAMYQIVGVAEQHNGNRVAPNSFLWSIANRVSYWMNLSGPSLTVDTACSSSLTALYLACEALYAGECSAAIVGGVNLDLHQAKLDINLVGGALSPDGVCRTFGKGANGYVAGEGIGAILLKPLDQAERDGDHIYGVIRSAAVNHGGRTSGYFVPNPAAQGNVITAALQRANVEPESIGYIEAHGTGTELGDPIEIAGLSNAFGDRVAHQTCAIGSIKTNIGHLEAAAGVVSVEKILLQMQHRKLAPSLHSAELNEHIDFVHSPFYVVQQTEDWNAKEVNGVRMPLRAGISSFGAGGANAHVILESYDAPVREPHAQEEDLIFPLSARNEDQLRETAIRLAAFLGRNRADLRDVAFTLQNGRKSFEQRVAILAKTQDELIEKLRAFIDGKKSNDVVTGHAKQSDNVTRLLNRREKQELVRMLAQGRDPQKIAALWAEGMLADWQGFASEGRRVPLPTYPFAGKRHWVGADHAPARRALQGAAAMHPFVDTNESTFERQIFKKIFDERDFFIYDHLVTAVPTLPGVAYLEFARKAGELAAGRPVRRIQNILWVSPISVERGQSKEVFIELKPHGEAVQFEVFSEVDGKKTLHSQGKLLYTNRPESPSDPVHIDLDAVRSRCAKSIDGRTAYPLFDSVGLHLGPSFQVLRDVHRSDAEVLGVLQLPEFRQRDLEELVLHPSLVDGSLQAGMAARLGDSVGEMLVPYSIGEVEILHPLVPHCLSYTTQATDGKKDSRVLKSNVLILDDTGKVLVRIRESTGVPIGDVHKKDDDGFAKVYYAYEWEPAPLAAGDLTATPGTLVLFAEDETLRDAYSARTAAPVVLVRPSDLDPKNAGGYAKLFESLASRDVTDVCFAWSPDAEAFLYVVQGIAKAKLESKVQLLAVNGDEALPGFVNTLRGEYPKFLCKVVEADDVVDALWAEQRLRWQDASMVRYAADARHVRKLKVVEMTESAEPARVRDEGVYLITGGAGGLGLIFAEMLATQHKARLVLTGRSKLSAEREAKLDALRAAGAEVLYVEADVANDAAVAKLVAETKARFGAIHGVIHSAGVLRDSYIRNKTADEMRAVFAPKILGAQHLDAHTKHEPLDFFVTFSSLAAVTGNPGQADYSYANAFLDAFASKRTGPGRSLSINWSLWADGGMRPDDQTILGMKNLLGMRPLATATGLEAFTRGLASNRTQFAILEAIPEKLEAAWAPKRKPAPQPAATSEASSQSASGLAEWLQSELTKIVMAFLKLDAADVSPDKILLDLGFDSIGLTTFANAVNEKFELDITPILFFDYPNLGEITKYLVAERETELLKVYGKGGPSKQAAEPSTPNSQPAAPAFELKKAWTPTPAAPERTLHDDPIAIVGISGVMPQSDDLDEFWDNLANARDLVTVIPRDRWNWEDYYGDPLKEANKSNSKWGGFMREVDKFDPLFFGISPREAQMMDPQQRMFVEHVWKAIEDSGHKVSDLSGTRTGLFVGVGTTDYAGLLSSRGTALDGYTASGNSHSVTANRVSFLFNLRGPSAPLDTACSSSLVAFHRALEAIHSGSCDMAIVGGVQVMLSPAAFISFSSAGMLSPDGKCKTFDKSANGYVRGEGCGAVLLKRLSEAERDGDRIYAIVKATAENHGGKVTTMTAPNSVAQTELLVEAYEKARVDPSTVGFIECHGTGTGLGDPIEIQALTKAFAELYKKNGKAPAQTPHVGLSSVKTNIGHLETGAGIAGVLKALLAMQHAQIPANLHLQEVNPYIHLENTPFFIADKLTAWPAPVAVDGTRLPRVAGVSSFGFGGANAHVVLEEYIPRNHQTPAGARDPQVIVLSAKNEDRVDDYARALATFLDKHDVELIDLAYTLQVGRDEMPARIAVVASSIDELKSKLATNDFIRGNTRKKSDPPSSFILDPSASASELAAAWVAGAPIDWRARYTGGTPRRISAPTYPFARERYWIPETTTTTETRALSEARLHPLVHRNVSTLQEQKYASKFTGAEFFLADHKMRGEAVLPAVAYVELVAAAGELSGERPVRFIRNMSWLAPITVGDASRDVHITLAPGKHEIDFAIRTDSTLHCRGTLASLGSVSEPAMLNVAEIQARCTETISGAGLYPFLDTSELILGRGFQVVQQVHAGASECLAVLRLPEHLRGDAGAFTLHPSLLDGALHSAIGMVKKREPAIPWSVPSSVAEIQIFGALHDAHYAHATWNGDEKLVRIQIQLLDRDGRVLVRMQDFVAKPFTPPVQSAPALETLRPIWTPAQLETIPPPSSTRIALLGDESRLEWLRASFASVVTSTSEPFDQLLWIAQGEHTALDLFRTIKSLFESGWANRKLQLTVIASSQPGHAGIEGLIGSLAKEYAHWDVRLLIVDSFNAVTARECLSLPFDQLGNPLAHRDGRWLQQGLESVTSLAGTKPRYRESGVYVVIGGAGGVGEVWTRFMIERYQANVVWIGRRPLNAGIEAKIRSLSRIGPAPTYIAADATNVESLQQARKQILETVPAIHGVVHSAIVLQDQSLLRMDEAAFRASLAAKLDITVNIDRVFGADALDFLLFFSSIVSFFKSPGQANYAAGSTFMDAFARKLASERAYPVRIINWGYWGSVGVVADDAHKQVMARLGLASIEPAEGMAFLETFLASDATQLALIKTLHGDAPAGVSLTEAMTRYLSRQMAPLPPKKTEQPMAKIPSDDIQKVVIDKLSEVLRLDAKVIRADTSLADYGVDSIIGVNFVQSLNEALHITIEPTKLFEYSTAEQLAEYIATLQPVNRPPAHPFAGQRTPTLPEASPRFARTETIPEPGPTERATGNEAIAIIGISGRFAESEDLSAFWRHLEAGDDLVRPVSRWSADDCVPRGAKGPVCAHASSIDSFDRFDAAFFGIPAQEATYMDPQQRVFLEESWRALEDAGYAGKGVHEKACGVYAGIGTSNYSDLFDDDAPAQAWWGNSQSIVPARIAYHLNLQGPAVAVDSACSSALVAIHLACQSLWSRETEMALAGGVYIQATSGFHQVGNRAGMLSPDGKCYSFDARANGFAPGEAAGVVVLKRLGDALRDGDTIHAVIRGSGINQDGKSNGLTAPNGRAQERLERAVYERFSIDPATIQVLEAHGTGTLLGDSIEHAAITRAFRESTDAKQFCAIGSVKTNIGHAGNAAGIASVLKLVLALKHRRIPPSLHFEKNNPAIDFASSPFYVNTQLRDWRVDGDAKRRGAVSSFGFSGTNAHLVLEEAPLVERTDIDAPAYLVVLSARTPGQLREQARNLASAAKRELSMNDLSFTLLAGRMHLPHRLSCVARSREELAHRLEHWLETGSAQNVLTAEVGERVREQAALKKFGNYCINECRETNDAQVYLENLSAIADLYVQGYALDYTALFPRGSRRIPLPAYPFARDRYWVDVACHPEPAQPVEAPAPATNLWLFSRNGSSHSSGMTAEEKIELFLKQETAQHLQKPIEAIPTHVSHFDLGLTSLAIAYLIRNLSQLLGEDLSPSALFEYTDIQSLSAYLARTYPAKIDTISVKRAGAEAEAFPLHPAKLEIREVTREEVLEQVLWQEDAALEDSWEKVTF